jgi:hypothetical protein
MVLCLPVSADAFDTDRLLECMGELKSGQSVNIPIYDFKNHRRCSESFRKVMPAAIDLICESDAAFIMMFIDVNFVSQNVLREISR